MEFKDVVKNRYSCKKYSERKVDRAKLGEMLASKYNNRVHIGSNESV